MCKFDVDFAQVARRGAKYGMLAPQLIQLEEEIDAEIAGEEPPEPAAQRITCDLMSLDEMVSNACAEDDDDKRRELTRELMLMPPPPPPPPLPPTTKETEIIKQQIKRRKIDLMSLDEMVRQVNTCAHP